jgi:hypothetical protein
MPCAVGCDVRSYRHQTSHPTSRACTPKCFHVYHVIKHTTLYKDIKILLQTLANAATQIQGESVIRERLVARVPEMGLRCPDWVFLLFLDTVLLFSCRCGLSVFTFPGHGTLVLLSMWRAGIESQLKINLMYSYNYMYINCTWHDHRNFTCAIFCSQAVQSSGCFRGRMCNTSQMCKKTAH